MKRGLMMTDTHSGHEYGLTPPSWWSRDDTDDPHVNKVGKYQRALWRFFTEAIDMFRPYDFLFHGGDMIEGKGERSGGVELITPDRHEQMKMACKAIDYVQAPVVRIHYGTRYHVGKDEDMEKLAVEMCECDNVKVSGHGFYIIEGVNIDIKHKVGGSQVPHTRHTAIARARLWNVIWNSEHERQPKAHLLLRGHNHFYNFDGGKDWAGVNCPALTYNSAFGIRECEGMVDVGMILLTLDNGGWKWQPILAEFADLKVESEYL